MSDGRQTAARYALSAAVLIASLALCDLLVARLVPRIRVYSELLEGEPYPAASSPYLPFTTPEGVTFRHVVEGRQIEYRFNEHGFRGPDPKRLEPSPGTRRILVCGDSFALGWGNPLDQTFVELLRRDLAPLGYEVLNAGYRGGYSPDAYYAYLRREGIALAPEVVVIALYAGNDLTDMRYNLWRRTDELGAPLELFTMRLYMDHRGRSIHSPERLQEILPWGYRIPAARRSHLFAAASQALDRGLARNRLSPEEATRRFALVARATARQLTVAAIEHAFLLIPPDPRRITEQQRLDAAKTAARLPSDSIVIDLTPRLDGSAYFDHDAHFNARGNRLAYEALASGLAEAGQTPATGGSRPNGGSGP